MFGATGNPGLAGMAGGAVYGGLNGLMTSMASGASAGTTASNVLIGTGNGAILGGFAGSIASAVGPVILGVMPNMVGVGLTGMATNTITGEAARMMKGQSGTNEDLLGDAIAGFGNAIFAAQVYSALQNYQPKGNSSQSIKDAVAKAIQRLRVLSCSKGAGDGLGKADWSNVSNKGQTALDHIQKHATPNYQRDIHGVFNGDTQSMVEKAWANRATGISVSDGMGELYIIFLIKMLAITQDT